MGETPLPRPIEGPALLFSLVVSSISVQVAARADQWPCDSKRPDVCLQNYARFRQVSSKPRMFAFDNDDDMIINLYSDMSKCALQLASWDRTESIEGATGCRYTVHVWSLVSVYGRGRNIRLVKAERLGQLLNVPPKDGV